MKLSSQEEYGLRCLLRTAIALLKRCQFEAVHAIEQLLEFALEALVGLQIDGPSYQQVECSIEVLFGRFHVPGLVVCLACLILLFDFGNQVGNRIDLQLWSSFRRFLRWRGSSLFLLGTGSGSDLSQGRRVCLFSRQHRNGVR